jgi:diaminohydroxyphosphoribosylaminopyrimidine deaminase/5-amino-6-(5-phosphoribosylamino)uracil reductase
MKKESVDRHFMKIALREAKKGLGRTSPNPVVGAVLVKEGKILSKGYHRAYGLPHAEVEALKKAGTSASGSTLYVTLEPCNHYGKTPPCTQAIIKSGVRRVVIGMRDPNPSVKGGGADFLKAHGIEVKEGVLKDECLELNKHYVKFVTKGIPFMAIKVAMTLDGWIATRTGHSKWITNEASRQFVHRLRDMVDAVIIGVGTVIADNPMLNTRLKGKKGKDPVKVIIDPSLRIPRDCNVLKNSPEKTIVVIGKGAVDKRLVEDFQKETKAGVIECSFKEEKELDLNQMLFSLAKKGIAYGLVEGGAKTIGAFIRQRCVDEFFIFKAPKLLGGSDGIPMAYGKGAEKIDKAIELHKLKIRRFQDNLLIQGYPVFKE